MIKFFGEGEITGLDDANIPVNLFTAKVKHKGKVKYKLSYDFFMPRMGLAEGGFLLADTKEERAEFIRANILPLYKLAFEAVTAIAEGTRDDFYYWNKGIRDLGEVSSDADVLAREGDTEEDLACLIGTDEDEDEDEEKNE